MDTLTSRRGVPSKHDHFLMPFSMVFFCYEASLYPYPIPSSAMFGPVGRGVQKVKPFPLLPPTYGPVISTEKRSRVSFSAIVN